VKIDFMIMQHDHAQIVSKQWMWLNFKHISTWHVSEKSKTELLI
jgi:hypothetical protein